MVHAATTRIGLGAPASDRPHRRALIRPPSPRLAQGLTTHIERMAVDPVLARQQWQAYAGALSDRGWDLIEVPPADDCPDGVFVEDTVVMFGDLALLTHPGAVSRRGEIAGTSEVIQRLGYRRATIIDPGTLDGGDVLKVGRRVYVGRGGRTNGAGVRQLRAVLTTDAGLPDPVTVTAVPTTRVLHLKSAVTALPDGTVIGFSPVVEDPGFFPHYRAMPEEAGAHVVDLGAGRLLMSAGAPRSAAIIADLGYEPVLVDISEFEKLDGCVTCLSVRLRTAAPTGVR